MNILLAGGTGYIGGRLAAYLAEIGHEVTVLTRKPKGSYSQIDHVKFLEINWANFDLDSIICDDVDVVINAAGMTSYEANLNPTAALELSKNVTKQLLDASLNKAKRFIQLSTFHVYRKHPNAVINEYSDTDGTHPYAREHLESEKLVNASQGIEGTVLRLANVFGPPNENYGDCWNLVINQMCKEAFTHKKIALNSSGMQMRNFLPISELIEFIGILISRPDRLPPIINIRGETTISIKEAAEVVRSRCQIKLGFMPSLISEQNNPDEANNLFQFQSIYKDLIDSLRPVSIESEIDSIFDYLIGHAEATTA
jgi:UDP-glucose 4-epimerase